MTAPRWDGVEFRQLQELRGPLAILSGVQGVGWDESCVLRLASGDVRHGLVLDVDRDTAVVQVLEGTDTMSLDTVSVRFDGRPTTVPVGDCWLGRTCNGRGDPIDGGPPVVAARTAPVSGYPLNPTARRPPAEPVLTGVTAVDLLTTLVRGQKLPVFSSAGLPHLELAVQIAANAQVPGAAGAGAAAESFGVVFAGMGLTHADAAMVRDALEERSARGELALLLNTADDPVIERILTPRVALTIAEHLAFELGRHVLVVLSDMTSYCEALREVSAARGEIPARRAYPGYLYSDLASLYERCGRIVGRSGSVTLMPVLTMPAGDITHPVPDTTGYITEGQIVLTPETAARGVYPPVDPLQSLSRLMRKAVGPGRTGQHHLEVANQLEALLARARSARELAELVGAGALGGADQRAIDFADRLERDVLHQEAATSRTFDTSLDLAWQALATLPRRELTMLAADVLPNADGHDSGGR